ncbi:MAG: VCBS repeat-containing protein, partial [Actinobacteria bacterium]|nr:VCBS repeat-containing protein [Actinomycetota bacterium]
MSWHVLKGLLEAGSTREGISGTRALVIGAIVAVVVALPIPGLAEEPTFDHVVIDADNPSDPHSKTVGDVDGDGLVDAIVASSSNGGMYWYEYPDWTKHAIRANGSWTTDMQVIDIDGDGDLDVVASEDGGVLNWYENPRPGGDPRSDVWTEHLIGTAGSSHHDLEVADVDGDGDADVVTRQRGNTFFWRQDGPATWTQITINTRNGEGTSLGDLDGDGDFDVAHNGFWMEQVSSTNWVEHEIDPNWPADVGVLIADLDGDGNNDVVLAASESTNERFSWYEAADPVNGPWTEHVIDPTTSFFHTFKAADMDLDGDLDLVTAEMHQSTDPDEVSVYLNDGDAVSWTQLVVATSGSHNLRLADFGSDGDVDIFGANWNDSAPNTADIEMWENQLNPALSLDQWQRHIVETSMPWRAVFVAGEDLNSDGLPDIVTGGWWYPNPGSLNGTWVRTLIGAPMNNMAAVGDFDSDGDLDVLGTDGKASGGNFSWAQNDGNGDFTIFDIAPGSGGGDFLQGVSVDQVIAGGGEEIVLSWHDGVPGTTMLTVPNDPTDPNWPLEVISPTTNGEQVATGDIDGDGLIDVHLGTTWLRQLSDGSFETRPGVTLSGGVPDRVSMADLDGDGDLDVVIGAEGAPLLIWGEN